MTRFIIAVLLAGCASAPMPVERYADAVASARGAEEAGAGSIPQGELHLRFAHEELGRARFYMENKDARNAGLMILRAKSDADLALAEARCDRVRKEARKAQRDVSDLKSAAVTTTGAEVELK